MTFENKMLPAPTWRSQLVAHLPLIVLVVGLMATLLALHVAVAGAIALAVAHVVVGLIIMGVRRYNSRRASS